MIQQQQQMLHSNALGLTVCNMHTANGFNWWGAEGMVCGFKQNKGGT